MATIQITSIRQVYQATEKQVVDEITGKIHWIGDPEQKEGYGGKLITVQRIGLNAPDRQGRDDKEGQIFVSLEGREVLGKDWKGHTVRLTKGQGGKGLKVWIANSGKRGVDLTAGGTLDVVQNPEQHQSAPPAQQATPPPQQQMAPPPQATSPAGQGSTQPSPQSAALSQPPQYEPEGYEPEEEGPYVPPEQETPQGPPSKREQRAIALEQMKETLGKVVTVYHACREAAAYEAKCTYIKTGVLPGHYGTTTSLFIDMMRKLQWDELKALPRAIDMSDQDQARVQQIMAMTPEQLRDESARQEYAYDKLAGRTAK